MKRYLVLFLITVFMVAPGRWMTTSAQAGVIASQVVDKAVPDNVIDEKSIAQRAMQFGQTIKNSIEQLANLESQLNTAKEMANQFDKAYSVYNAVMADGGIINELYYEAKGLINDVETISSRASQLSANGQMPLNQARDAIELCDIALKDGMGLYDFVRNTLLSDGFRVDAKTRIDLINEQLEKLKKLRKQINDNYKAKIKQRQDSVSVVTAENLMASAYSDKSFVMVNGQTFKIPTVDEYLALMEKNDKLDESQKGTSLKEEEEDVYSIGKNHAVRDFLLYVIGILALLMTLPAYLKYNSGERQSLNTIWKLVAGTVVMIGIVFLFDEIVF